jgi:hypothetical protein
MPKKTDYTVIRVPDNDWNNIMETVTLDGSYSDEIKDEVWTVKYPFYIPKLSRQTQAF